jgi:hypothetical protein
MGPISVERETKLRKIIISGYSQDLATLHACLNKLFPECDIQMASPQENPANEQSKGKTAGKRIKQIHST